MYDSQTMTLFKHTQLGGVQGAGQLWDNYIACLKRLWQGM